MKLTAQTRWAIQRILWDVVEEQRTNEHVVYHGA